jgi:hypothetical protein
LSKTGLLLACFGLMLALPQPVRAREPVRGYLNPLTQALGIDSLTFSYQSGHPLTMSTPRWGGVPNQIDSVDFEIDGWPDAAVIVFPNNAGNELPPWEIPTPIGDNWYPVPARHDTLLVMLHRLGAVEENTRPTALRPIAVRPSVFAHSTVLSFDLAHPQEIALTIVSAIGNRVRTLACGRCAPGGKTYTWFGDDDHGAPLLAGVYFVRLKTDQGTYLQKLILRR